jgi:hypothetical protein
VTARRKPQRNLAAAALASKSSLQTEAAANLDKREITLLRADMTPNTSGPSCVKHSASVLYTGPGNRSTRCRQSSGSVTSHDLSQQHRTAGQLNRRKHSETSKTRVSLLKEAKMPWKLDRRALANGADMFCALSTNDLYLSAACVAPRSKTPKKQLRGSEPQVL